MRTFFVFGLVPTLSFASESVLLQNPFDTGHVNIRTNALYLARGWWNLSAEIPLSRRFTFAPTYLKSRSKNILRINQRDFPVFEEVLQLTVDNIGAELSWYLNSQPGQDGVVIVPAIYFSKLALHGSNSEEQFVGEENGVTLCFQVSQQWYFENGINFRVGGGIHYRLPLSLQAESVRRNRYSVAFPALMFGTGLGLMVDASVGFVL